jgi:hypothetical protein
VAENKPGKIMLIFLLFLNILALYVPHVQSDEIYNTAVFRPKYPGYGKGTISTGIYGTFTSQPFTREINLEAWNPKVWFDDYWMMTNVSVTMFLRWAALGGGVYYTPGITVWFSLDRGASWTHSRSFGTRVIACEEYWGGSYPLEYYSGRASYYFPVEDTQYFTPETYFKIEFFSVNDHWGVVYWGSGQRPIPPYDYIDGDGNYVQYDIEFTVEYQPANITYVGETIDFPYNKTKEMLSKTANMILNTMQLSGASNEVVGKQFGTDTWIIIYSSQIAMMKLIDLLKIMPENASIYLGAAKRFIAWMWSKQNLTDGSFPFILTNGVQHPWYNSTADLWYGYDKIDSFSACAISLMAKYHNATGDLDFVNKYWNRIFKAKEFLVSLMNMTYWLPVDGYHYDNDTGYVKSDFVWLHDACEVYQGIKDYAYLEGIRGNTSEQTYWNNYAGSIANGIRIYFWNETLGRYAGMFNVTNGIQNTALVYNIITPMLYGVETNVTRAMMTIEKYVHWGILSGRYYEVKWAEDYSVYNEYSTMSGMILSSFATLIQKWNYTELWMKTKFFDVTKFLFANPVYPDKNLQNDNGFLDFVNFVNYTWAKEYARLVETSAWIIDGFMNMPTLERLANYTTSEMQQLNQTINEQQTYWDNKKTEFKNIYGYSWNDTQQAYDKWVSWLKDQQLYVQWYDFELMKQLFLQNFMPSETSEWWTWDWSWTVTPNIIWNIPLDTYVLVGMGLFGFFSLIFAPVYMVAKFKKGDWSSGFCWGVIFFLVGIGLVIAWLWK